MSFTERLARARTSSKLQARSWQSDGDIEYLTAAGMVQQKSRNRLGVAASRAIADDGAMVEFEKAIKAVLHKLVTKHRWKLHPKEIKLMAGHVAKFIINPNCTSCGGRGFHIEAQLITSEVCQHCKGSGVEPIPTASNMGIKRDIDQDKLEAYFKATLAASEKALGAYLGAVKMKLGHYS